MTDDELKKIAGAVNPCCGVPENIEICPTTDPHFVIRRCKVCGCNHYWMLAEPISLGATLAKP
jgi:hypothetical protein